MTRRRTNEPAAEPDGFGEIPVLPAVGTPSSRWDRLLVGVAALALGGGVLIAIGNALAGPTPSSPVAAASVAPSVAAATPSPPDDSWVATAVDHRDETRDLIRYTCPAHGRSSTITGTGVYTDDSSVCTAAVHMGLLNFQHGGVVTIQPLPSVDSYLASIQHGLQSGGSDQPAPGGFVFADVPAPSWATAPTNHRGAIRRRFTYTCSRFGRPLPVWGTRVYTDDSSVCTAGVQMGIIRYETGGKVTIEMRPGRASYGGSIANGVVSDSWDSWPGSFVFVRSRR